MPEHTTLDQFSLAREVWDNMIPAEREEILREINPILVESKVHTENRLAGRGLRNIQRSIADGQYEQLILSLCKKHQEKT